MKTLATMNTEIRTLNTEKGWRTGDNTFGDYEALLQSEIAEMTENYRDHRLDTYTVPDGPKAGKPDDVGSEAADVLIRTLDMCDVFGVRLSLLDHGLTLDHLTTGGLPNRLKTFGDHVNYLHKSAAEIDLGDASAAYKVGMFLCDLIAVCRKYRIDLEAEYERKMAFNWKRPYQHGGRTLSDNGRVLAPATPAEEPEGLLVRYSEWLDENGQLAEVPDGVNNDLEDMVNHFLSDQREALASAGK